MPDTPGRTPANDPAPADTPLSTTRFWLVDSPNPRPDERPFPLQRTKAQTAPTALRFSFSVAIWFYCLKWRRAGCRRLTSGKGSKYRLQPGRYINQWFWHPWTVIDKTRVTARQGGWPAGWRAIRGSGRGQEGTPGTRRTTGRGPAGFGPGQRNPPRITSSHPA